MDLALQNKDATSNTQPTTTTTTATSTSTSTRAGQAKGSTTAARVVAVTCLLLLGLSGAGLLVWWVLVFHRSNEQLWMVPVSLVLIGTPVVTWLSVFASAAWR